jgi:hypothetical protein
MYSPVTQLAISLAGAPVPAARAPSKRAVAAASLTMTPASYAERPRSVP